MHTYILYIHKSTAGGYVEIVRGTAANEREAFKELAGNYYKIEIEDERFKIEDYGDGMFLITTKTQDYVLKRT